MGEDGWMIGREEASGRWEGGREQGEDGRREGRMVQGRKRLCYAGGERPWRKGGLREGGLMKGTSEEGTG